MTSSAISSQPHVSKEEVERLVVKQLEQLKNESFLTTRETRQSMEDIEGKVNQMKRELSTLSESFTVFKC